MSAHVVIIVPTQGKDVNSFLDSAQALAKKVYNNSVIIRAKIITDDDGNAKVDFTWSSHPFSWETHHNLRRVLTISHGMFDGPNLAFGDSAVPQNMHQPWGVDDSHGELSSLGKAFWGMVGRQMNSDGKILLLGCLMGGAKFATNVAGLTGKKVYAATSEFAAGNANSAVKAAQAIEGSKKSTLVEFAP